jgi:hypothetical protein
MPWRPTRGVLLPCSFALLPTLLRSQRFSSLARLLRCCSGGCSNTCDSGKLFYVPSFVSCHTCVVLYVLPHFIYFLTRKLAVCLSVSSSLSAIFWVFLWECPTPPARFNFRLTNSEVEQGAAVWRDLFV